MTAPISDGLLPYQRFRLRHPERAKEQSRRSAAKQRQENPEKFRARDVARKYGLTVEEHNRQLVLQNYACCACGDDFPAEGPKSRGYIDHNHASGQVRGILCHPCNAALGFLLDSPERLRGLALYAELWSAADVK